MYSYSSAILFASGSASGRFEATTTHLSTGINVVEIGLLLQSIQEASSTIVSFTKLLRLQERSASGINIFPAVTWILNQIQGRLPNLINDLSIVQTVKNAVATY